MTNGEYLAGFFIRHSTFVIFNLSSLPVSFSWELLMQRCCATAHEKTFITVGAGFSPRPYSPKREPG